MLPDARLKAYCDDPAGCCGGEAVCPCGGLDAPPAEEDPLPEGIGCMACPPEVVEAGGG